MIRQATAADLDQIVDAYEEHFAFEETHPAQAFTVFKRGVYPTRRVAEKALADDGLTVYEEDGRILASVITSGQQPPEYANVAWQRASCGGCARDPSAHGAAERQRARHRRAADAPR